MSKIETLAMLELPGRFLHVLGSFDATDIKQLAVHLGIGAPSDGPGAVIASARGQVQDCYLLHHNCPDQWDLIVDGARFAITHAHAAQMQTLVNLPVETFG